ncbi:c-type cytochrome [Rheinheimera riviphila]|uniref:C-type cytochrome n=1 Tax=Rheinheimera riviphila TaxID=1834037 RepID=A0A437QM43_9GAMM|nr:c-type cytochrome [Rheinheimera riviphila]RVU35575.1 c-type cytochrome [Rheinheimera riviphila]
MRKLKTLKKSSSALFLLSLLLLLPVQWAVAATADTCNACHAAAVRKASKAPQLAGQSASYLKKQLLQFQLGERGAAANDMTGQQMAVMAKTLTAAEIETLAIFYSQQTAVAEPVTGSNASNDAVQLDQGRRLYIGSCGACHGAKAEGNPALNAPVLQMLGKDYLQLQVRHFRDGVRGVSKTDKPGRQMALMSRELSDADIEAVAAYIGAELP